MMYVERCQLFTRLSLLKREHGALEDAKRYSQISKSPFPALPDATHPWTALQPPASLTSPRAPPPFFPQKI